jgi:hypothetical protein
MGVAATYLYFACLAIRTSKSGLRMHFTPSIGLPIGAKTRNKDVVAGWFLPGKTAEIWALGIHFTN